MRDSTAYVMFNISPYGACAVLKTAVSWCFFVIPETFPLWLEQFMYFIKSNSLEWLNFISGEIICYFLLWIALFCV